MINRLKDEKGQILPFAALTLLALVMFWMTVVNVGKMVTDRIMLQNAADAAAQSAACMKARALNSIGSINALLGIPVQSLGGISLELLVELIGAPEIIAEILRLWDFPEVIVWWPYVGTELPYWYVNSLITAQEFYNYTLGGVLAYAVANDVARENGADYILSSPNMFSLDGALERNKGLIVYCDTLVIYGIPIPIPTDWRYDASRWLELKEDEDEIHNALKVTVMAVKNPERGFFPLGKGLLGIYEIPAIYAIASARPYNTEGPMFPSHGQTWGVPALKEYLSAMFGGYDAHLIPVGSPFEH
jgi:hypothetical protein